MTHSLPSDTSLATSQRTPSDSRFYAIAWRWHFYAGLYVVPFLLALAITGLVMVYFTGFQNRLGNIVHVQPQAKVVAVTVQAQHALDAYPGATLQEYMTPKSPDAAAWVMVAHEGRNLAVAVDPYTAQVLQVVDKGNTVFQWARDIHGNLLAGDVGKLLVEVAAGLGIVMIITGLYLFWPRGGTGWREVLVPAWTARGRRWWKSLHASIGFWLSLVLLCFLLTGLSWTTVWGGKFVQPWGTFPAAKWDAVPLSDQTHASLNTGGEREVPWGLEQTPLPLSGANVGTPGVAAGEPVNLDGIAALAYRLGYSGQFHISVPQSATGVYTLAADTMSGDLSNPFQDRTVHVDRYTGKILAEAAFADYSLVAKGMAIGIALHQGDVGLWSAWANVLICLLIVLLCVSGVVMWWIRRPRGSGRLAAPGVPAQATLWKGGAVVMLVTALLFPLSGAVMVAVLVLDWAVFSRLPLLRKVLG
jgi:uncharacterized iron-regulated membrane protein